MRERRQWALRDPSASQCPVRPRPEAAKRPARQRDGGTWRREQAREKYRDLTFWACGAAGPSSPCAQRRRDFSQFACVAVASHGLVVGSGPHCRAPPSARRRGRAIAPGILCESAGLQLRVRVGVGPWGYANFRSARSVGDIDDQAAKEPRLFSDRRKATVRSLAHGRADETRRLRVVGGRAEGLHAPKSQHPHFSSGRKKGIVVYARRCSSCQLAR